MPLTAYEAYDSAGRRKYLNAREGKAFLKAAAELPLQERLLCELLYYVGCRISEAISLTAADLDSTDGVVRIFCLKKRDKPHTRRVPVPGHLMRELGKLTSSPDKRLFPISRMTSWRIVKRVMSKARIKGIHACPKGLRHGFGVRGIMKRVPIHLIQRWMGHASPQTTAIYLAVMDEEERKLIRLMWD